VGEAGREHERREADPADILAVGDAVAAPRAAAAMGGAADAAEGGVGRAAHGTGAAVDVAGVARGAMVLKMLCVMV
jgi:hypothetical protein